MEFSGVERIVEDLEGDEGWVTHDTEGDDDESSDNPAEMTLDNSKIDDLRSKNESQNATEPNDDDDDEEAAMDMEGAFIMQFLIANNWHHKTNSSCLCF